MAKGPKNPQTASNTNDTADVAGVEEIDSLIGDLMSDDSEETPAVNDDTLTADAPTADIVEDNAIPEQAPDNANGAGTDNGADGNGADNAGGDTLSDDAKAVLQRIEGGTVQLLNWEDMPTEARTPKRQVRNAIETIEEYDELRKKFVEMTSGKEEKAAAYIAAMVEDPNTDEAGWEIHQSIAEFKRQITELEAQLANAETAFSAHVDAELTKSGQAMWDDATTEAKKTEIREYFAMAKTARDSAVSAIETFNKHRAPGVEELGNVDQYVPKIETPKGGTVATRSAGSGSGSNAGGKRVANVNGERPPQVSDASYSLDNGATWIRAERYPNKTEKPDFVLSNPAELAPQLSKALGVKVERDSIIDAWLDANDMTFDTLNKAAVKDVTEFKFEQDGKSALVRLTRKTA